MSARPAVFPDATRSDAGTVLVSSWVVGTAERQRIAADLMLDEWEARQRPDALLSLNAFLSLDGGHILYYAQWTNDEDHLTWVRNGRAEAVSRVDSVIPGIERPGLTRYQPPHTVVPVGTGDASRRPGFVVAITFRTESPAAQRALTNAIAARLRTQPIPGLIAAHVHDDRSGDRVLNWAEWADEQSWRAFVAGPVSAELAQAIEDLPGVTPLGGVPYRLHRSLVNVAPVAHA
ncbi:antibiotic biosynthesis monooxygenase [Streptomyces sp. SID3343]|uniref:antibiotic biosynthesis monooxygenase n=1 Tax=Streptomyces sp. SID3343 TaxID=2690260 RepID=UPI001369A58F|nr:antibiotic biosynthesis monooxygenase [Streptomyces sp. SID3343]MYW02582.1 antibiotic biosynthesis monooxygenase [Streptomyces sp. SID3343]